MEMASQRQGSCSDVEVFGDGVIVDCERMVDAIDQNGDGVIDHSEFVKFFEQSFDVEF